MHIKLRKSVGKEKKYKRFIKPQLKIFEILMVDWSLAKWIYKIDDKTGVENWQKIKNMLYLQN